MPLKFVGQLGVGGFGVVDLVQDEDGNRFARKTFALNQTLSTEMTENVKKRFIREAKVQQGFSHKNIVPVVGGELDGDPPFYLMPVASSTLADEIRKDRTLSGKFVSALSDIVAALEELHGLDIFHRDLKPQNVLRLTAGGGDTMP
jgi:eukaryotic-like serine/threonine-protein kinase